MFPPERRPFPSPASRHCGSPLQLPTRRLGPLAEWTTPQRPQVRRLLHALYLQSGLIVTRAFSTTQRSR